MRAVYVLCGALALGLIACGGDSTGSTNGGSSGSTGTSSGTGTSSTTGDSTVIATNLNDPQDLAVGTDKLFFSSRMSGQDVGLVESLPIGGGSATTINGSTKFPGAVAIDASNIYWFDQDASGDPEIMKAGLDGSGATALGPAKPSGNIFSSGPDQDSRLFVSNGNLYWGDSGTGVMSMPVTGGAPTVVVAPTNQGAGGPLRALDSSGLTYIELSGTTVLVRHAALDGSNPTTVGTVPFDVNLTSKDTTVASDGTNVYWAVVDSSGADEVSTIYKAAISGGAPVSVLQYTGDIEEITADASGIYFYDSVAATEGIYKVDGSSSTLFQRDDTISTSSGNQRLLRLDAQNLYWVAGGYNAGQAVLHKKAR